MKHNKIYRWMVLFVICMSLVFTGCTSDTVDQRDGQREEKNKLDISEIENKRVLAVEDSGSLVLIDIDEKNSKQVYVFEDDQLPPRRDRDTFLMTQSNSHVVWYSPMLGILAYDIQGDKVERIYQPSQWFNQYPFIFMHPTKDDAMIIDNEGKSLIRLTVSDKQANRTEIPYPFGTRFLPSLNFEKIAYIAGYDENANNPSYLITDIDGNNAIKFTSTGSVPDRDIIAWHPDGIGLLTKGENGEIVLHMLENPDEIEVFFIPKEGERVIGLDNSGKLIIVHLSDGSYRILDGKGEMVASYPASIMSGMRQVEMRTLDEGNFLLEETMINDGLQTNRLWLSNWFGSRDLLYPSYHQTTIIVTEPIELEVDL